MKSTSRSKASVPAKKLKTLKSAECMLEEQRIVMESLLESINKHLDGIDDSKKDFVIDDAISAAHRHGVLVAQSCRLTHTSRSTFYRCADVLETLANECKLIRSSLIESVARQHKVPTHPDSRYHKNLLTADEAKREILEYCNYHNEERIQAKLNAQSIKKLSHKVGIVHPRGALCIRMLRNPSARSFGISSSEQIGCVIA